MSTNQHGKIVLTPKMETDEVLAWLRTKSIHKAAFQPVMRILLSRLGIRGCFTSTSFLIDREEVSLQHSRDTVLWLFQLAVMFVIHWEKSFLYWGPEVQSCLDNLENLSRQGRTQGGARGGLGPPPPPKLTPAGLNESCKD